MYARPSAALRGAHHNSALELQVSKPHWDEEQKSALSNSSACDNEGVPLKAERSWAQLEAWYSMADRRRKFANIQNYALSYIIAVNWR